MAAVAALALGGTAHAQPDEAIEVAMRAAFGPAQARVSLNRHNLLVRPVAIKRLPSGALRVEGRLTHIRRLFDDQVPFSFVKRPDGSITDLKIEVTKAEWKRLVEFALAEAFKKFVDWVRSEIERAKMKPPEGPVGGGGGPNKAARELATLEDMVARAEALIGKKGWYAQAARVVANVAIRAGETPAGPGDRLDALRKMRDAGR